MKEKELMYEAFGELLYSLCKADGEVQPEEKELINHLLEEHPWASEILWSFNYEHRKAHPLDEVFKKAIIEFKDLGPREEYKEFVEILEIVAKGYNGVSAEEKQLIRSFTDELTHYFKETL